MHDLPTPDQILEELADKTAAQIDRMAPVAFDGAFSEMTRYHRFLLALNASRMPDGSPFNYAEVAGDGWRGPHRDWIRQYARLFERAAGRIPDEGHFIRSLAYTPIRLLPRSGDPELPPNIIKAILDLGPIMMHRIEAWVTKRTTVETREGGAAEPRLALAGSDAKAYANVLPELVGGWESLLQRAPSVYMWRERSEHSEDDRWSTFRASWPFLWQHLSNTAYTLAVAVWNDDEAGTVLFREALVRWRQTLGHRLDHHAELRRRRLLFPDILKLKWSEVNTSVAPLTYDYMPPPTPDQLFASVVRGAHDDVLLLTAAVLLFWTINDKQLSNIGARTAKSLLRREGGDEDLSGSGGQDLSLRVLFLDLLRTEIAGGRFREGFYANDLDHLVEVLDNMTERQVVPGRGFTPSTMHGRDDLLLAVVPIVAAATPEEGDDGLAERIVDVAQDEMALPEGDRSLRNVVRQLGHFRTVLEQSPPQLARGVSLLAPNRDAEKAAAHLREIVSSAEAAIEAKRLERLRARPINSAKLERLRASVETALLTGSMEVPFFRGVRIERGPRHIVAKSREAFRERIEKAQLVEPPMASPISNLEESIVLRSQREAGGSVWAAFVRRNSNAGRRCSQCGS